jgi:PAS domain S-box-containing protein
MNELLSIVKKGIVIANNKNEIILFNSEAQKIFDYTSEQIIGKSLDILIPDRFVRNHQKHMMEFAENDESTKHMRENRVLPGKRKDGTEVSISASILCLKLEEEPIFIAVIEDCTDRLLREQELQTHSAQMESITKKLGRYLSPQLFQKIFRGEDITTMATHRKKLTVFISDIKDFTEIVEKTEPSIVSNILNDYLSEMTRIAIEYGGTVDKFVGDAVVVFFGDPHSNGEQEDAYNCINMAIAMQLFVKNRKSVWKKMGLLDPLEIRCGISTGFCTVGNFGSVHRMDYTIIGNPINLASRLESLAETGEIIISQETHHLVEDIFLCTPKGTAQVKGFARPISIYKVVGLRENLDVKDINFEKHLPGFSVSLQSSVIRDFDKEEIKKIIKDLNAIIETPS